MYVAEDEEGELERVVEAMEDLTAAADTDWNPEEGALPSSLPTTSHCLSPQMLQDASVQMPLLVMSTSLYPSEAAKVHYNAAAIPD